MLYLQLQKFSPEKITLTVVEMQQLPDIGKSVSKKAIFCLNWTIYNGRTKVCLNFKSGRPFEYCRVPLPKQFIPKR